MSKVIVAVLAIAAFVYAVWLVALRRPLPDPSGTSGLRRRFLFAVLIFVAALGGCRKEQPVVLCYTPAPEPPVTRTDQNALKTLRSVWLALDPKSSDKFNRKLDAAVASGAMVRGSADILAAAYSDLAYHKSSTRSKDPGPTCYEMTILGSELYNSRETALKQLELLDKLRASGTVDADTADKARQALAREFQMLYQARHLPPNDYPAEAKLADSYKQGGPAPSADARGAAAAAVDMEGAK